MAQIRRTDVENSFDWHDSLIYSLHFDVGDSAAGDWRIDLVLDIDFITEWHCDADGTARFRVAPATLIFHDVADLRIALDFADGRYPRTLNEPSIARITSKPAAPNETPGQMSYRRWSIELNHPQNGEIAFGASGYTRELRAEPVLVDDQRLPANQRTRLVLR